MIKFANKKIDLSDEVVITHKNVKTLGEKLHYVLQKTQEDLLMDK